MSFKGFGFDSNNRSMIPAVILIGLGVIGLLAGIGIFRFLGGFVWAAAFGALAYYAYTEGTKRGNNTWRLAAFPLAGLAIAVITPASFGGGAFLVPGDDQADRPGAGRRETIQRGDKGGDVSLHVRRAAPVNPPVMDFGGKRRMRP